MDGIAIRQLLEYGVERTERRPIEGEAPTPAQLRAWRMRRKYLKTMDRLRTYTLICERSNKDYTADDFSVFRDADLCEVCMRM